MLRLVEVGEGEEGGEDDDLETFAVVDVKAVIEFNTNVSEWGRRERSGRTG